MHFWRVFADENPFFFQFEIGTRHYTSRFSSQNNTLKFSTVEIFHSHFLHSLVVCAGRNQQIRVCVTVHKSTMRMCVCYLYVRCRSCANIDNITFANGVLNGWIFLSFSAEKKNRVFFFINITYLSIKLMCNCLLKHSIWIRYMKFGGKKQYLLIKNNFEKKREEKKR